MALTLADVSSSTYVIHGGRAGRQRLRTLSAVLMPTTLALLDRVGIAPTARCLDVGCGGGDVTVLLAERASGGHVVGVDRDPVKIDLARAELPPHVELRVEDIADTVRAEDRYDVVYARFLLSHLADAAGWVSRLAALVAPGGHLVVEDTHISGMFCSPRSRAFDDAGRIYRSTVAAHGGDADIGPSLPRHLHAAGLVDVGIDVVQPAGLDGDTKQILGLTLRAVADNAIAAGVTTRVELDVIDHQLRAFADRPDTVMTTAPIVQTWGRRPA